MNILFVYFSLLIPTRGGTERVACSVANALKQQGHHVYFLTTCATPEDSQLELDENYFLIDKNLDNETKKLLFADICHKKHIDIIINEMGELDDFTILSREALPALKIITCLHFDIDGFIGQTKGISFERIKIFLIKCLLAIGILPNTIKYYLRYGKKYRTILKTSDAVVTVTPIIAQQLKKIAQVHPKKIHSILNPLSFGNQQPTYNIHKKEKVLLYVGRFDPVKNVDKILKAWALVAPLHPEWKLELAGTGELYDECVTLSKLLHIPRVHFHGHVADVAQLYERAEYLILASSHESFSCVVLESMAYGCHPIVFDYPSAKIVIPTHRIGTRIKQHSVKALAKVMTEAILSKRSNKHHMEEVKAHLSQFNMDKLVNEWQHLLEHVSTSKSNA